MSRVQALLENEEVKTFLDGNKEAVNEAEMAIGEFPKVLKAFILEHPTEFVAENLEETRKNIRIFTEVATAQFVTEITNMYAQEAEVVEEETAAKLDEYL